jgi:hypothetical protein
MLANFKLVISEFNYNPAHQVAPGSTDKNLFEFIELYNAHTDPINLLGVQIQTFNGVTQKALVNLPSYDLQPGEYALVVRDVTSFLTRYGQDLQPKIVASYINNVAGSNDQQGGLPDSPAEGAGRIRLATPAGINPGVTHVPYDDGGDFPRAADGKGATLVLTDPGGVANATTTAGANIQYSQGNHWHGSPEYGGSPGRRGLESHEPRVVINELLTNSNNAIGELDAIELANISNDPVDISGWMLTDNENDPVGNLSVLHSYYIPEGTMLQPGGYYTVDESQFNSPPNSPSAFAIKSTADPDNPGDPAEWVFLVSREPDGTRLREDEVAFDTTRTSQSIGRAPNLTGSFWPLQTRTFGAANSPHVESPIVITEIMYKRTPVHMNRNYIELYNRTTQPVTMSGATPWYVSGVSFQFPTAGAPVIIPAETAVLLVAFNPGTTTPTTEAINFRDDYGLDDDVKLYGPFGSNLSNNGERLTLVQPVIEGLSRLRVLADSVDFQNDSPWPEGPNGGVPLGSPTAVEYSLQRVSPTNIGDLPHSWRGALPDPGRYSPPATSSPLEGVVISEVMYNPLPDAFDENGEAIYPGHLEFIEILNSTATPKNLAQAGIGQAVSDFRFPTGTTIAPSGRLVVVPFHPNDVFARTGFFNRYGIPNGTVEKPAQAPDWMFGPWTRNLNNEGESVALFDNIGNTFFEFTYNDRGDWPERAAGNGSSLEVIDPNAIPNGVLNTSAYLNNPAVWRASTERLCLISSG